MTTRPEVPRKLPSWAAPALVFVLAIAALAPTTGDIGLTWDEPSYRYSQVMSAQWWGRLFRNPTDPSLFTADALLYYWPYGRFGINFHPPLAGQLDLLTYELFGGFMKDIPARRMASVIEFALTLTILYQFLARRYGAWVAGVAAASLLLMPRVYGDAHIAGTDTPGLLLWAATAVAFWKGLHEPNARRWRIAVGMLAGLAFVEKMGAVMVVLPLILWLVLGHMPRPFRRGTRADWIDGLVTSTAMLVPIGLAFREIRRLADVFLQIQRGLGTPEASLSPANTDLFIQHPPAQFPAWIVAVPLAVWIARRVLARALPRSPIWGVERPALETWTAMLAFGPVVAWLGNPAWWRETLPRLAHYYAINTERRGVLPDIKILYFGQTYEYSLPWHNAWVLIAITVPASILAAAIVGLVLRLPTIRRDRVPLYFLLHLLILPVLRMGPTPAHDGVRLFLPTFFFLAAFAGWGTIGLADLIGRSGRDRVVARSVLSALVLLPAAWGLVRIHPFELSYYNELIGGPRGAWARGFELSYWYEAFDGETIADLNRKLPDGAMLDGLNKLTEPPTFTCLQELGQLKGTIVLGSPDPRKFPYLWILTHDSKANGLTRLAFAMTPYYERRPGQLDGLRVVTVDEPRTVAQAWALQLLADDDPDPRPEPPSAPVWVRSALPPLARFWGEGVTKAGRLRVNERAFAWARADPDSLRAAARAIAEGGPIPAGSDAARLGTILTHGNAHTWTFGLNALLRTDPTALLDAVEILIARPDAVRKVLTRYPYTDPTDIGGPLDSNPARRKD
jgi:4-amino-4-deoxy-L-arabinose transferase-like glycosyltransferase